MTSVIKRNGTVIPPIRTQPAKHQQSKIHRRKHTRQTELGISHRHHHQQTRKPKKQHENPFSIRPLSRTRTHCNGINTIEQVQRRAGRWVTSRHHQTCNNSIIDSIIWPTLQQRRENRLELFYKFNYYLVAVKSVYLPKSTENS